MLIPHELIDNIALLMALGIVHSVVARRLEHDSRSYKIILGLAFGSIAAIGMTVPLTFAPGVIVDGRSVLISLAGLFGGPLAAGLSALIASAFRIWLGGSGEATGILIILSAALLGTLYHQIVKSRQKFLAPGYIYLFGFVVQLVSVLLQLTLPTGFGLQVIQVIGLPVMVIFPFTTLIMAIVFLDLEKRVTAERKLQESEERLQVALYSIGDGVIVTGPGGLIQLMNDTAEKITGWKLDESKGRRLEDVFDILNSQTGETAENPVARVMREGSVVGLANHTALRRRDGELRQIADSGAPIRNSSGEILGVVLVFRDVTEEYGMRQALSKSEEEYRLLFENMTQGFALHDIILDESGAPCDYRFININPAFEELTGLEASNLIGRTVKEVLPGTEKYWIDTYGKVALTGEPADFENYAQELDRHYHVRAFSPRLNQFAVLFSDISKRKQAEAELKIEHDRYLSIFDSMNEPIYIADMDSYEILFANKAIQRTYDQKLTGETCYKALHHLDAPCAFCTNGVLLGQKGQTYEWERHNPITGRDYHLMDRMIDWPDGRQVRFEMALDITERNLAENAARERAVELEALYSLLTRLSEAQTPKEVLSMLLGEMRQAFQTHGSAVVLLEPNSENYTVALADGLLEPEQGVHVNLHESLSGKVLQSRQPYIAETAATGILQPGSNGTARDIGPVLLAPMQSESMLLGLLIAVRGQGPQPAPFSMRDLRLLSAMSKVAANALHRNMLFDEAQRRLKFTQALHDIDVAVAGSLEIHFTLDVVLEHCLEQLDVDAAAILLLSPNTLTLEFISGRGFRTRMIERSRLRLGEGQAGRAALERKLLQLHDLRLSSSDFYQSSLVSAEGFQAYFAVPLIAKGQVQGVLEIFNRSVLQANPEWLEFLETLAGQAALAIDSLSLFAELQRSNAQLGVAYDATIAGWSMALDLRDKETEGHTLRVTELSERLAREMGLSEMEIVHIRRGALLHDIGKIGVPDSILLKPDKLTPEEWEIMRKHPEYAYDMLLPIEYLRPALDIPYCHHEKWDGSGYPKGLKGEQIPLAARIFSVIDVWDALTSARAYRPAWSRKEALDYIREQTGTHFDPAVVHVFLRVIRSFEKSR